MISLIAFLTATSGFLNEMNLAQTLTATMGGTALRYQMTFGLFTFSLGFGAWLFDSRYAQKFSNRKILLVSQVVMIALSLGSPHWMIFFNPLERGSTSLFLQILCHIPIVFTGIVTGLELPALLSTTTATSKQRFSPLAWDYIGMFVASFLFPLYFLYSLGVHGTAAATAALAFVAFALIYFFIPQKKSNVAKTQNAKPKNCALLSLIFFLSFCSFSYELILAKIMGDILRDETLAYSLGVGIMLVGLGIGTYHSQKSTSPLKTLSFIELGLVCVASITFVSFYFLATTVYALPELQLIADNKWMAVAFFSPLPLAIGWLTGFELPLLLKQLDIESSNSLGVPLALNYLGALASGLIVPLVLLPLTTPALSLKIIACFNFIFLCVLVLKTPQLSHFRKLALSCTGCLFLIGTNPINAFVEQLYLKTYYYELSLSEMSFKSISNFLKMTQAIAPIQREVTTYQYIDKIKDNRDYSYFARDGFTLFLNKQQQLQSAHWRTYHETFALAATLAPQTSLRSVLICGGGDGLLARVLLEKYPELKIDLIELDPRMIELSNTDADMLEINNYSLQDPRVNVRIDDAYASLFRDTKMYDAIFLDFPYPDTFELSRLYSLELYTALLRRLSSNGFVVFDAPIWRYIDRPNFNTAQELRILTDTLQQAGFKTVFPFGTFESFIFAQQQETKVEFSEDALKDIADTTYANLISLDFLYDSISTEKPRINSVFHPQPFFKQ